MPVLMSLGHGIARRAGLVALTWLVLSVLAFASAVGGLFGDSLFDRLSTGPAIVNGDARIAQDMLTEQDPYGPSMQLLLEDVDPTAAELTAVLSETRAQLEGIDGVAVVNDPLSAGVALVSTSGSNVLIDVAVERDLTSEEQEEAFAEIAVVLGEVQAQVPGSTGTVGGTSLLIEEVTDQVETDLRTGEGIALPISLLVMLIIFGGFAAAGLPIIAALASIAGGLVSLLAFSHVTELDASVVNVVTVIGLGLCIDYSLLVVSRYREEIGAGQREDVPDAAQREIALGATMATAGRTVMFSGITVAIAVSGMLFFRIDIIRAVGLGAASVVVVAVLAALTLVPALLVLTTRWIAGQGALSRVPWLGRVAKSFGGPPPEEGFFSRLTTRVQRRPWLVFLSVSALLIALAIPALRLNIVDSGPQLLPPGNTQRDVFLQIQQEFPATAIAPIQIVTALTAQDLGSTAADIAERADVERTQVREVGNLGVIDVFTTESGKAAQQVVRDLRIEDLGFTNYIGGPAAHLVDYVDEVKDRARAALLTVILATFVLLFLLTGSVLIPVKALIMNVLSLGATFGVLVLIFQDGRFEDFLQYQSTGGIESTIPVLVFAFAFGLSMDYEVFLLSRIKEAKDTGVDNDTAVRIGLQRTGRVITSAGLLVVIVFSGFVLGELLVIKETGVALAVAVLLDATLVRILLVPATMTLLGEWNWWAPAPLRRLHNRFGISD